MLKTEVSKRLDTSVFSILLILMGNVGNALLVVLVDSCRKNVLGGEKWLGISI